jgi:hypothetical protein
MQEIYQPGEKRRTAYIPGQSTANAADEWPVLYCDKALTVTGVRWIPAAAVTGDNTNYFSLAAQNKGTAGAGTTAVTATKAYTTGTNSVAFDAEDLTLSSTAADLNMAAGEVLTLKRTVAASGLAQPDGLVEVTYKYR